MDKKCSFKKWLSIIADICGVLSLLISSCCAYNISIIKNNTEFNTSITGDGGTAIHENNNYYGSSEQLSKDEAIIFAQQLFKQEKYEAAYDLFLDWKNEEIPSLYLGYMYSNGIVVSEDYDEACKYYKQSAEARNGTALENYLYINLNKPLSYDRTIEAIKYGFSKNNRDLMMFLHTLMTDSKRIVVNTSDDDLKAASYDFISLSRSEQEKRLSHFLIYSDEEIIELNDSSELTGDDFVKYISLSGDYSEKEKDDFLYINIYQKNDNNNLELVGIQPIPVSKTYCIKYSQKFMYAEKLFSESLPEI